MKREKLNNESIPLNLKRGCSYIGLEFCWKWKLNSTQMKVKFEIMLSTLLWLVSILLVTIAIQLVGVCSLRIEMLVNDLVLVRLVKSEVKF